LTPRFDPYAVSPPGESWGFIVDDEPIRRAPAGSDHLLEPDTGAVRLAPDVRHQVWRNEYVFVSEELRPLGNGGVVSVLSVRGTVFLRGRGLGADLLDFEAKVIDPSNTAGIVVLVGGPQRAAVERKVLKVVEWHRSEMDLRDQSMEPLLTASELWNDFRRVRMTS
jgi:hypothetical protein